MKHLITTTAAAAAAAAKAASDAADRHAANRRSFVHCFTALPLSELSQLASPQARSELAYLPGYIAPWQSRLIILCARLSFLDAVSTANHFYQQCSMNRKRIDAELFRKLSLPSRVAVEIVQIHAEIVWRLAVQC